MLGRYQQLIKDLEESGQGIMTCRGNSMLPVLTNPSRCLYRKETSYEAGDIVFCRVRGRYVDAHWVKATGKGGYLIANNRGYENGWTKTIYGRVVQAWDENHRQHYRAYRDNPRIDE